jgi:hypothetical protein
MRPSFSQISFQRADQLVDAAPSHALSQLPDSILEAGRRIGRHAPFDLILIREGESKKFARVWPRDPGPGECGYLEHTEPLALSFILAPS